MLAQSSYGLSYFILLYVSVHLQCTYVSSLLCLIYTVHIHDSSICLELILQYDNTMSLYEGN